MHKLSVPQMRLLHDARNLSLVSDHGALVSGQRYRTALALERKGYGSVQYQGPNLGWFRLSEMAQTQWGEILRRNA